MVRRSLSPKLVTMLSLSQSQLWVISQSRTRSISRPTSSTASNKYTQRFLLCPPPSLLPYFPRWWLLYPSHTTVSNLTNSLAFPYLVLRPPLASSPAVASLRRAGTANLGKSGVVGVCPASGAPSAPLIVFTAVGGRAARLRRGMRRGMLLCARFPSPLL